MGPSICSYRNDCALYRKTSGTAAIMVLKKIYCYVSPSKCEILKLWLRGQPIPTNLLPDGTTDTTGEGKGDEH